MGGGWTRIRHAILFTIGGAGLIYEIFFSYSPRPALLVTDLVLVGIVPAELIYQYLNKSRQGDP